MDEDVTECGQVEIVCPDCGGEELVWGTWATSALPGSASNRPTVEFYLGCEECSCTVINAVSESGMMEMITRFTQAMGYPADIINKYYRVPT